MEQAIKDAENWLAMMDDPKHGYLRRDPQTNIIRAMLYELKLIQLKEKA